MVNDQWLGLQPLPPKDPLIIMTTLFYEIPPHLPFPKGGTVPLLGKEG
jgi:hypothetical protein